MNKYKLTKIISFATFVLFSPIALADKPSNSDTQDEIKKQETSLNKTIKEKQLVDYSIDFDKENKQHQQIKEGLEYLSRHPAEFEKALTVSIRNRDTATLTKLLPIYEKYLLRDQSVVDWGNALIAESNNDYNKAVNLYRKINSALPNIKLLRFHMANALFKDKQYEVAKSEFEKLRSEEILSDYDKQIINSYLEAISQNDRWNFDMGISYVRDPNINNSPKKGTQLVTEKGVFTSNTDSKVVEGVSYNFETTKQWALHNNKYISGYFSGNGSYYWNSHQHNDLILEAGLGFGYADAKKSFEVTPFFQNNFYVNASEDNSNLKQYYKKFGVRLTNSYWLNENIKYSSNITVVKDKYISKYKYLSGNNYFWSNTLFYMPNQRNYFYGGLDLSIKTDTRDDDDSYNRFGSRVGWGRAWGFGISTRMSLGFAEKYFKGKDFTGIKRKDKEYNLNMSVWHRNIHFLGITPRLTWSYKRVDGNHPFYNYDKSNIYIELSKTF